MAAGNFVLLNEGLLNINNGSIDIDTHTFVCVLLTSGYTPAPNTHEVWSDLSGSEVAAGGGYTAGGEVVTLTTSAVDTDKVMVDCTTNPTWNPSTITAKYAAIVKRAGGSLVAGDLVLGYVDLETGGSLSSSSGPFTITWNANGLFRYTRS